VSRAETGFDGVAPIAPPRTNFSDITANELAWVDFLRLISNGSDPGPTLRRVQLLRRVLRRRRRRGMEGGW
jgi:hypothetical protein